MPDKEIRMLQSSAMGYGSVSPEFIRNGLDLKPDLIVGQGTSSDPGPAYLGADNLYGYVGKPNKKRDIGLILEAAHQAKIPFIFSGGSPSGSEPQLQGTLHIVNELCRERGYRFRIAVISGEVDKEYLKDRLRNGAVVRRVAETPRLSESLSIEEVEASKRIVAQMGPEPVMQALQSGVDGVITGRALDIGLHMAYPLLHGFDIAVTAHMAKTIECGALCATPPLNENVFAILHDDHFLVFPLNPARRCTISSVAAHTFYERPDISREMNPGGYLDLSGARYEQMDDRTVKAMGAKWVPQPYTVKLEGVKAIGYRTITINGLRDPNLVRHIDVLLTSVRDKIAAKFKEEEGHYRVDFHLYGRNAVLGPVEPITAPDAHELGLVISAIAETQSLATSVCGYARGQIHFGDYPNRTSTAGNIATLFSPAEIEMGQTFVWSIWHALSLDDPGEPFRRRIVEFPNDQYID